MSSDINSINVPLGSVQKAAAYLEKYLAGSGRNGLDAAGIVSWFLTRQPDNKQTVFDQNGHIDQQDLVDAVIRLHNPAEEVSGRLLDLTIAQIASDFIACFERAAHFRETTMADHFASAEHWRRKLSAQDNVLDKALLGYLTQLSAAAKEK